MLPAGNLPNEPRRPAPRAAPLERPELLELTVDSVPLSMKAERITYTAEMAEVRPRSFEAAERRVCIDHPGVGVQDLVAELAKMTRTELG